MPQICDRENRDRIAYKPFLRGIKADKMLLAGMIVCFNFAGRKKLIMDQDFTKICMVCEEPVKPDCYRNPSVNLPVCEQCRGTEKEKEAIQNLRDGMADGFVCGCI